MSEARDVRDLYQDMILEHCKKPRNFRSLPQANRKAEGYNPLCGDHFTVFMQLENDEVKDISFEGSGCAISKASASMMTASRVRPRARHGSCSRGFTGLLLARRPRHTMVESTSASWLSFRVFPSSRCG
jgi:NifU-like N terminal domain